MDIRALALACIATTALALGQTTGVPGINDYTINGSACSGSPSCTSCCFATPVALNCSVSAPTGSICVVVWSFCPCFPGFSCGPTNFCVPAIPSTACGSSTNQSLDLVLGCVMTPFVGVTNTAGLASVVVNIPPLGPAPPCSIGPLSTQAVVIDPCGAGASPFLGPFVLTQAYSVTFW
jgi:hypothetical protein